MYTTPEGEITQGIGLAPDIECFPTPEGYAQNKDELLEKAVEIISDQSNGVMLKNRSVLTDSPYAVSQDAPALCNRPI